MVTTRSPSMVSASYLSIRLVLCHDCSYAIVVSLNTRESVGGDGGDIDLVHVCGIGCCVIGSVRNVMSESLRFVEVGNLHGMRGHRQVTDTEGRGNWVKGQH